MTDVFISYSRKHRERILPIVEALRDLHIDVWFDAELRAGAIFGEEIEARLVDASCVLVLWTKDALAKGPRGWVHSEADWAHQRGKLIQARLEEVRLPPPFFSSVSPPIDLSSPKAIVSPPGDDWVKLVAAIGRLTKRAGLSAVLSARQSDDTLVEWEKKFPSDPIVRNRAAWLTDARTRLRNAKVAEAERLREIEKLEAGLRALSLPLRRSDPPARYDDLIVIGQREPNRFVVPLIDSNLIGLEFYNLGVRRSFDGDTPTLLVSGEILNTSREAKVVPPIRIALRDARGQDIYQIINRIAEDSIGSNSRTLFEMVLNEPPPDAVDLEATFATTEEFEETLCTVPLVLTSAAP